jgi:hypothetical protein
VDAFMTKPTTVEGFNETVSTIQDLAASKNLVNR